MTLSVVPRLALKDLYLNRWIILGSTLAGAVSLLLGPLSQVMFYVASVSFVCVLVILNIFLVMSSVVQERKEKVQLFVLSLPLSTRQYMIAKIAGNLAGFGAPWLVLTALSLLVIDRSAIPNGLIPLTTMVSVYLLMYYCVLLAVGLVADSPAAMGAAIVTGNVSINFFVPFVFRLPSVRAAGAGPDAVWGADVIAILLIEAACGALALAIGFVRQSRKTDFI